jgi:hypothetical protein
VQAVLGARDDAGNGVTGLVPRDDAPLLVGRAEADALLAEQHAVARGLEVTPLDDADLRAHRDDGRLVEQVGQVGTARAGRQPRQPGEVDVGRDGDVPALACRRRIASRPSTSAGRPSRCGRSGPAA